MKCVLCRAGFAKWVRSPRLKSTQGIRHCSLSLMNERSLVICCLTSLATHHQISRSSNIRWFKSTTLAALTNKDLRSSILFSKLHDMMQRSERKRRKEAEGTFGNDGRIKKEVNSHPITFFNLFRKHPNRYLMAVLHWFRCFYFYSSGRIAFTTLPSSKHIPSFLQSLPGSHMAFWRTWIRCT